MLEAKASRGLLTEATCAKTTSRASGGGQNSAISRQWWNALSKSWVVALVHAPAEAGSGAGLLMEMLNMVAEHLVIDLMLLPSLIYSLR